MSDRLMITHPLACPECGAELVLKPSRFGQFYGCIRWATTGCTGSHGAHPDGSPMGVPADAVTKRARIEAHAAFDTLWSGGRMTRKAAYRWLCEAMGMTRDEAHISRFDAAHCRQLVECVARELATATVPQSAVKSLEDSRNG